MQAFASSLEETEQSLMRSSKRARMEIDVYEAALSLRIASQKVVDLANKLPVIPSKDLIDDLSTEDNSFKADLEKAQLDLFGMNQTLLSSLLGCTGGDAEDQVKAKKSKKAAVEAPTSITEDEDSLWAKIEAAQEKLSPKWESVLNKWHARVNFGSEKSKSKLKVFNTNIWDQINEIMMDDKRVMEKSCVPFADSERIGVKKLLPLFESQDQEQQTSMSDTEREQLLEVNGIYEDRFYELLHKKHDNKGRSNKRKTYDLEVYDDRQFYSFLLRVSCPLLDLTPLMH